MLFAPLSCAEDPELKAERQWLRSRKRKRFIRLDLEHSDGICIPIFHESSLVRIFITDSIFGYTSFEAGYLFQRLKSGE